MSTTAALPHQAPLDLWRLVGRFLNTLYDLFGGPEHVAFRHTLTLKPYTLLRDWLRAAEALMRRLLLIEASHYPAPNLRPLLRGNRPRVRKLMGFDEDHPEQWRVSFRCSLDRRRPRRHLVGRDASMPARAPAVQTRFRSAWPLAERYEALIRVFNNPIPYAKRLAARLHAKPHLARTLIARPKLLHIATEQFAETLPPAEVAANTFCNTS